MSTFARLPGRVEVQGRSHTLRSRKARISLARSSASRSGDFDSELTLVKSVSYCEQPPSFVPAAAILVRILSGPLAVSACCGTVASVSDTARE